MACERFKPALRGAALGAPLPADAAAHLAVCAACQTLLETEAQLQATIDGAISEVASARPSPDFAARVREHVERTPRRIAPRWLQPAVIAAAAVVVAVAMGGRFRHEKPASLQTAATSQNQSTDRPAATSTLANPGVVAQPAARKAAARGRRQPAVRTAGIAVAEVLVPAQQREAVGRLIDSLRAGRPEVVSALMNLHEASSVGEPNDLTIAPIRIEPVVVSALPSSPPIIDK